MLSQLTGIVQSVDNHTIHLIVGPMGFALQVPNIAQFPPGKEATVLVYMHWNAENGPSFFGFKSAIDKQVFEFIISCSGIGPKIGLAVLGDLGASGFVHAVQMSNDKALSKVNGIGAKKAEQIIFQLRSKVEKLIGSGVEIAGGAVLEQWHTVSQALESLNYSRVEISRAMSQLRKDADANLPFDQLMRKALSLLSK
jgi:Holliday junction DNA helicase RuvA